MHLGIRCKLILSLFPYLKWRAICFQLGCAKKISHKNVKLLNCLE